MVIIRKKYDRRPPIITIIKGRLLLLIGVKGMKIAKGRATEHFIIDENILIHYSIKCLN